MIPAEKLSPRAVNMLMEYLRYEIRQAENERRPLEEKWLRYQRMYRTIPEFERKDFPFIGASNVVVPVIATDVDTIFSRLMGILFGTENLWSCRPLNDGMIQMAPRLEEFLQWGQHNELGVYDAVSDWLLELCKLGTGILKQRYRRESKVVYQFRETDQGTQEQVMRRMIHDHPVLEHVSLWDFLIPATATTIQNAPWVAENIGLTWQQLEARERAGLYRDIGRLANARGTDQPWLLQQMQDMDKFRPGFADRYDVKEVWLDFDISGMGEPQAIVATIHLPSMTFLRIDYNPFLNQEKPFSAARYLRVEKRFYGIGVAEMLEHQQDEATTTRNQRIDNRTIANSTMYKARKGIGIKEDEPIWPGRWFLVDEMDDVQPMNMGQRFDDSMNDEQTAIAYGSKRTGVNDYISGEFSNAMGYSTASVGVQQLRESAKRFDQTIREIRVALGESGTRIVELYQQFNQAGKEYMAMGQRDGALVHQILQFPMELIRHGVGIEVTATSAAFNKDVEVRTNTLILQMLNQFYGQSIQGLQYYLNPQLPPQIRMMALRMVDGGSIMLKRILDTYGVQDVDRLVPELQEILNGGQQQQQPVGAFGGANFGAAGGLGTDVTNLGMVGPGVGNQGTAGFLPAGPAQGYNY